MKKLIQSPFATLLLAGTLAIAGTSRTMAAEPQSGEVSGNLSAVSTYVWRGMAQTVDAALQGGIDYQGASGLHFGAWTSNVAGGSELDLSVGLAGAAGSGITYDIGLIAYFLPQSDDADFQELYIKLGKDDFELGLATSSDAGTYLELNGTLPKVVRSWDLNLHVGHYDVDEEYYGLGADSFTDIAIGLSKQIEGMDLGFTLSDTSRTGDDFRIVLSLSKDFAP